MRRAATIVVVALLVVSLVGMTGAALPGDQPGDPAETEVAPGEHLSGVVGVNHAELNGQVTERGFAVGLERAASNESKAELIAAQLNETEQEVDELEARMAALEEAREAGNITHGQYRAGMAQLAVELATVERLANQTQDAANGLPAELRAERGIDVERIELLRANASELSGPEVAEIAREIAGPHDGERVPAHAQDRAANETVLPEDREQPDDRGPDKETDNDD